MITAQEASSSRRGQWHATDRPKATVSPNVPADPKATAANDANDPARLQEALHRSEQKSRALLNTIVDLVFTIRKDGMILDFQAPKESDFMLSAEGIVGRRIMELLPVQIAQQAMYHLEKALRTGQTEIFSYQYPLPGRIRDFETRITMSGPGEALALVRDVTDRKVIEKEILDISNKVQARLGQDLHDGLGQHLTGITFLTRALERKLSTKSLPEAVEAAEIGRLVLQALAQTRNLARGLFPVELESSGLVFAFRELAANVENLFGISCDLECDENLTVTDLGVSTHLFRLAQEAINNSVKHGKAKRVSIRLHKVSDRTVLVITDNGQGFPKDQIKPKGLGLRIMHYRAQKIGGSLEINAAERGGTVITCAFKDPAPARKHSNR